MQRRRFSVDPTVALVAVSLIPVLALPGRPTWAERAVIVALLVAGGVVVELAQVTFTANRGFEEIDVAANVWGSLAGTVVVWLADRTAARPTAARLGP